MRDDEDDDRHRHHEHLSSRGRARTGDTACDDLVDRVVEGLELFGIDVDRVALVPETLERVNDQSQPSRLDHRHRDTEERVELSRAVKSRGLKHSVRNRRIHEVLHEVQTKGSTPSRNDDGKVSIDPVERTHRDEVRDTGDGRVKHKGEDYELEHPAAARKFDLSERVSRERGEEQVSESTDDRDEHSVEYVSRERHPRCGHELEEVGEVLESRAHHVEARREHPQLVKRLQGLHDNVEHRKEHERAHDDEQHVDSDIASDRTVEDNFMFSGSESCHIIVPPSIIIS